MGIHRPLRAGDRRLSSRPRRAPRSRRPRAPRCCRSPRRSTPTSELLQRAARLAGADRGPLRRPQRGGLARRRPRPRARRGAGSPEPIRVEVPLDEDGAAVAWRTLIVLEEGAEAEVWEHCSSQGDETDALLNSVVELHVGQAATLRYVSTQDISERAWIFATQRAQVERDGRLDWTALGFGSARGKVRMETNLAGPGSEARVTGGYAGGPRPAPRLRHHPGARRAQHHLRPRLPRRARRRGDRGLARDDPSRPRRPGDRRLPGEPQPAALPRGPRRRDPRASRSKPTTSAAPTPRRSPRSTATSSST